MRAFYVETIGIKQLYCANGDEYEAIFINVDDGSYKKSSLTKEEFNKVYEIVKDMFDTLGEAEGSRMVTYE